MIDFTGKTSDFLKIGVAAAARGDAIKVQEILSHRPEWLTRIGSHGRTMLWEACHRGKLEVAQYLVEQGADLNACGTHYTPYFVEVSCYCIARFKGHLEVAEYLLARGATRNIHTAAFLGDIPNLKPFLAQDKNSVNRGHPQTIMADSHQDVDFIVRPCEWATPLCYALRGGCKATVELLIESRARVQGIEEHLFLAANEDPSMVRLLLENGADPKFAPSVLPDDGELYDVVKAFGGPIKKLAEGADLVYLCRGDRGGNPSEVKRLIKFGADVNHQDHKGKTALHRAAKAGFRETVAILLTAGARIDTTDVQGETPIFDAIRSTVKRRQDMLDVVQQLIATGANLKHKNLRGQTVHDIALKCNDKRLLHILATSK